MKIIAQVDRWSVLAQLNLDELMKISGDLVESGRADLYIGRTYKVSDAWKALGEAKSNAVGIQRAATALRAQADALDGLLQPYVEAQLEAQISGAPTED